MELMFKMQVYEKHVFILKNHIMSLENCLLVFCKLLQVLVFMGDVFMIEGDNAMYIKIISALNHLTNEHIERVATELNKSCCL